MADSRSRARFTKPGLSARDRIVFVAIFFADRTEWLYRGLLVTVTLWEAYAFASRSNAVAGAMLAVAVAGMHWALRTRLHPDDDPDLRFLVEMVMLCAALSCSGLAGGWISAVPLAVLGTLYMYGFLRHFGATEE